MKIMGLHNPLYPNKRRMKGYTGVNGWLVCQLDFVQRFVEQMTCKFNLWNLKHNQLPCLDVLDKLFASPLMELCALNQMLRHCDLIVNFWWNFVAGSTVQALLELKIKSYATLLCFLALKPSKCYSEMALLLCINGTCRKSEFSCRQVVEARLICSWIWYCTN